MFYRAPFRIWYITDVFTRTCIHVICTYSHVSYVFVCAYMYNCFYVGIHIPIYVCISTYIYTHMYAHVYICVYIYTYIHIYIHAPAPELGAM